MKKALAVLAAAFLLLAAIPWTPAVSASAADGDFEIRAYHVAMTVGEDCKVQAAETITVEFFAPKSGIIRDFDLTDGVRFGGLSALRDGEPLPVSAQHDTADMLSWYLGDPSVRLAAGEYTYELRYAMTMPAKGTYLPLDVLGFDWQTEIRSFTAEISLPAAAEDYRVYSGSAGAADNLLGIRTEARGNVLLLEGEEIGAMRGVTLDLLFPEGTLRPAFDLSVLWALLLAVGFLGLLLLVKAVCFRQPLLVVSVNLTAPEEMDPLLMGKLVDGTVDNEDLGALVFWLAAKGYLEIDLTDEKDPLLIRTAKDASDLPAHARVFLAGMFALQERVNLSSLKNTFYGTADAAKTQAGVKAGKMISGKGKAAAAVFGVLCTLLFGGGALLYALLTVGAGYVFFGPVILCAIAYAVSCLVSLPARYREPKGKRAVGVLWRIGATLLGCLPALFAWVFLCAAFSPWSFAILVFGSSVSGMVSTFFLIRTEEYTEKLGKILGFRDFIRYTERDKIASALAEKPELYYDILPYAQVLGVTKEWTEKFEGLAMSPPVYLRGARLDVFDLIVFNSVFRSASSGMARVLSSRPSNSGGGHFGGHFGGGSGGGGFGGGGGRSF